MQDLQQPALVGVALAAIALATAAVKKLKRSTDEGKADKAEVERLREELRSSFKRECETLREAIDGLRNLNLDSIAARHAARLARLESQIEKLQDETDDIGKIVEQGHFHDRLIRIERVLRKQNFMGE